MKLLAYVFKGGKVIFRNITHFLILFLAVLVTVYIFYALAVDAEIPIQKFDKFMRSLFLFYATGLVVFVGIKLMKWLNSNYEKGSLVFLFNHFLLSIIGLVSAGSFEMKEATFSQLVEKVFLFLIGSGVIWFLCFLFYRLVAANLFRRLFTNDLQNRCEDPVDTHLFFLFQWIERGKVFTQKYFRNPEEIYIQSPVGKNLFSQFFVLSEENSNYQQLPISIKEDACSVSVRFKFTPITFTFYERISFSRRTELEK